MVIICKSKISLDLIYSEFGTSYCSFKAFLHVLLLLLLLWYRDQLPITNFKKMESLGKNEKFSCCQTNIWNTQPSRSGLQPKSKNVTMTKKMSYVCSILV